MTIAAARLPKDLPVVEHLKQLIMSDETLLTATIRNEDISQLIAKSFSAAELRLEKVNATQAKLEKTSFSDVELVNCDLIATGFPEASWRRVVIKNSRCSGLQLQTGTLKDITFSGCKLNLANFRFSKLSNVCFQDCVLDEADFYAAQLQNVAFVNCNLNKTEFSGAKLRRVDFRTSDILAVLGIGSLAGAIIDSAQLIALAPLLASVLKIEVRD
jgi:uncharacterized protein YjbI with pentapeptide repeats